jgi:hypothetical protein
MISISYLSRWTDTSRAITTLNLHGHQVSPTGLVDRFEVGYYFEMFDKQMANCVTSVSVNGDVLGCLLHRMAYLGGYLCACRFED